jgi:3-oxoacyl-[acyl-carrier protein] reductase
MSTPHQKIDRPSDLSAIVALVTGGSRGIGRAIAAALAARGARVVITGRNDAHLREAASAGPGAIHPLRADVTRADEAAAAVRTAVETFGGLDVLVNNAGIGLHKEVADTTPDEWRQLMATNLDGVFFCTHAAIPHLRARGSGWIINISSLASVNPFPGGAAYCASKAGLNAFSEALMQEVRHDNIRVSYIMPGSVNTEFGGHAATANWKIAPADVADLVVELVAFPQRSLPSRIEIRPSRPPKR